MPKNNPPVRLQKAIYDAWLAENPKSIEGGPIVIQQDTTSVDPNMVMFPSHHLESDTLPTVYAEQLMIFGYSNQYEGFRVWVTPLGFDYLLMAHHRHHSGVFTDQNGQKHKDQPHFHELELNQPDKNGVPQTKRVVTSKLVSGMPATVFLEEFLEHYYFDDGRVSNLAAPATNGSAQRKLYDTWQ